MWHFRQASRTSRVSSRRVTQNKRPSFHEPSHVEICHRSRTCGVHVKNMEEECHACCHEKLFRQRHEGAFRPLGEEQRRSGKSHPGRKGFRELFPRAHHSRRVLRLGLPGQGWCRREQSGSTGVDRQECQQNRCGPTNYLGRHSHAAIEVRKPAPTYRTMPDRRAVQGACKSALAHAFTMAVCPSILAPSGASRCRGGKYRPSRASCCE